MRPRTISTVLSLKQLCLLCNHCAKKNLLAYTTPVRLQHHGCMYNNKGSTKPACNDITRDIWLWCLERHNFVSAVHIPGSTYIEAEFESRVDRHEIEWRLDERFFLSIVRKLGGCDVDLFASRVNAQLKSYVSWRPDPDAMAVDVFTLDWSKFRAFCFPPFTLISRVLQTLDLSGRVCDCGAF